MARHHARGAHLLACVSLVCVAATALGTGCRRRAVIVPAPGSALTVTRTLTHTFQLRPTRRLDHVSAGVADDGRALVTVTVNWKLVGDEGKPVEVMSSQAHVLSTSVPLSSFRRDELVASVRGILEKNTSRPAQTTEEMVRLFDEHVARMQDK